MARLTATTFPELRRKLDQKPRLIGNNTIAWVPWNTSPDNEIQVRLHDNHIVTLRWDGVVEFNLCHYPTVTTREQINQFLPPGVRLVQRQGVQTLVLPDTTLPVPTSGWVRVLPARRDATAKANGYFDPEGRAAFWLPEEPHAWVNGHAVFARYPSPVDRQLAWHPVP